VIRCPLWQMVTLCLPLFPGSLRSLIVMLDFVCFAIWSADCPFPYCFDPSAAVWLDFASVAGDCF